MLINLDRILSCQIHLCKKFLKNLLTEHFNETGSDLSKKLIEKFNEELNNFVQVCPKEMVNKLENKISLKSKIREVS